MVVARSVIAHDPYAYTSHPCVTRLAGGDWLLAYSRGPRLRRTFHPPDHPMFVNELIRSSDNGRIWSEPVVIPGFDWSGVETPGIVELSSGEVLLNQWRFLWLSTAEAEARWHRGDRSLFAYEPGMRRWLPVRSVTQWARHCFAYARADDGAYVHRSLDGGRTWVETVPIDIAPYRGAFSPKGAYELVNGDVVLALGSHDYDPLAAGFVLRSTDKGRTWSAPIEAARVQGCVFSEPSVCQNAQGTLILLSREEQRGALYQSDSTDGGRTWTDARPTGMVGYPAHIISLSDGRVMAVFGHRQGPYGIHAAISTDEGASWSDPVVLVHDLVDSASGLNLGYPSVVEFAPGEVFVAFYAEDGTGVTCVQGVWARL